MPEINKKFRFLAVFFSFLSLLNFIDEINTEKMSVREIKNISMRFNIDFIKLETTLYMVKYYYQGI